MSADPVVTELCCPTCGAGFSRLARFENDDDANFGFQSHSGAQITVHGRGRPYLTCWHGHKWTIKTITRTLNRPDRVLLGDFLGN